MQRRVKAQAERKEGDGVTEADEVMSGGGYRGAQGKGGGRGGGRSGVAYEEAEWWV